MLYKRIKINLINSNVMVINKRLFYLYYIFIFILFRLIVVLILIFLFFLIRMSFFILMIKFLKFSIFIIIVLPPRIRIVCYFIFVLLIIFELKFFSSFFKFLHILSFVLIFMMFNHKLSSFEFFLAIDTWPNIICVFLFHLFLYPVPHLILLNLHLFIINLVFQLFI